MFWGFLWYFSTFVDYHWHLWINTTLEAAVALWLKTVWRMNIVWTFRNRFIIDIRNMSLRWLYDCRIPLRNTILLLVLYVCVCVYVRVCVRTCVCFHGLTLVYSFFSYSFFSSWFFFYNNTVQYLWHWSCNQLKVFHYQDNVWHFGSGIDCVWCCIACELLSYCRFSTCKENLVFVYFAISAGKGRTNVIMQ